MIYYIASGGFRYFVEADNQYDVVQLGTGISRPLIIH